MKNTYLQPIFNTRVPFTSFSSDLKKVYPRLETLEQAILRFAKENDKYAFGEEAESECWAASDQFTDALKFRYNGPFEAEVVKFCFCQEKDNFGNCKDEGKHLHDLSLFPLRPEQMTRMKDYDADHRWTRVTVEHKSRWTKPSLVLNVDFTARQFDEKLLGFPLVW